MWPLPVLALKLPHCSPSNVNIKIPTELQKTELSYFILPSFCLHFSALYPVSFFGLAYENDEGAFPGDLESRTLYVAILHKFPLQK
jgi:hypothetical protein